MVWCWKVLCWPICPLCVLTSALDSLTWHTSLGWCRGSQQAATSGRSSCTQSRRGRGWIPNWDHPCVIGHLHFTFQITLKSCLFSFKLESSNHQGWKRSPMIQVSTYHQYFPSKPCPAYRIYTFLEHFLYEHKIHLFSKQGRKCVSPVTVRMHIWLWLRQWVLHPQPTKRAVATLQWWQT